MPKRRKPGDLDDLSSCVLRAPARMTELELAATDHKERHCPNLTFDALGLLLPPSGRLLTARPVPAVLLLPGTIQVRFGARSSSSAVLMPPA
jgi:hypothetical protein